MKIQDLHIGQKVRDINTKWELIVTGLGVLNLDMDSPSAYAIRIELEKKKKRKKQ